MQSIKVYHAPSGQGPNPWKVVIVLEELGLPWEIVWIPYGEIKSEPYTSLNPNGRLPAMVDPNKNVTLWETGAIINYLVATYDKDLQLTYGDDRFEEKWLLQSWLMFQMSGQGPMFGQKIWFTHIHVEQNLQTAIDRYGNESKRIMGVVEGTLRKQRQKLGLAADDPVWLVGDKCTYADLAFVPWNTLLGSMFPDGSLDLAKEFPEYYRWHLNMTGRPGTKKVLEYREECIRSMSDTGAQVVSRQKDARQLPKYEKSVGVDNA
ncbi:glutathione transferase [Annulohypoxylon truncatum]|uniref:glutathione transferase n=1 Tax=Annulohypoxylon truncatum TaxID=327061 RepID=UPI002008E3F6|nr:glutathione transferase [Annulohypoxylon truncatum]KAI1211701.1 glutathione transferase [Annulohypoxylon truncatum]